MAQKKQTKRPAGKKRNIIDAGTAETEVFVPTAEVAEEFIEAQRLGSSISQHFSTEATDRIAESRVLSGGDVDAALDLADAGDEAVGGSASTPGQDEVDEIGKALGISYEDDEPLGSEKKLLDRDRNRWELDPASSEGYRKRSENEGEYEGD